MAPSTISGRPLDVLFVQDFTGSQQPFIDTARAEIRNICAILMQEGHFASGDLKFGVAAFRDHPPQARSFVTKALTPGPGPDREQVAFTVDPGHVANVLSSLEADEGGDGPEAVADALQMGLRADWRDNAFKVAIMITDAPPHGLGEEGDGFPHGCPLQIDPLRVVSSMANAGITLYVIACEPDMSRCYDRARSFYEGLVKKTGGRVLDLGDTSNLPSLILGTILETIDHEAIVSQNLNAVQSLVEQDSSASNEMIARELHVKLRAQNVQMRTLNVEGIVPQGSKASKNAQAWFEAETLEEGMAKILDVETVSRYISEAPQPLPTIETRDISLSQVEGIVQKARMRSRPIRA
ncbi:hypothetical protein AX14_006333 [Amanita brunnescens Koide BX004]|nr:hypothetical protein AX14_006333 [Amanita brunnescens Koide BX004]